LKKYLQEMLRRKDLVIYLVVSGLKAQYRNTFLGYLWWIIDPLLRGLVYYFLRVVVLGMKGENIGAFLIIGLVTWKWISSAVSTAAKSISSKSGIITQVYLPKAILPLGTTLSQLVNFCFGLVVVIVFLVCYRITPGVEVLWFPVIMAVQFLFLLAISLVLAYYCTFVRDVENVISHIMRLWFYASPVIWETGRLPARLSYIVDANPASAFIVGYRNIFMYQTGPDFQKLFIIGFISLLVILYMIRFYQLNEHKIIKAL
jgi:lipopolysaccharide transport system permease protein/teichoic acid transport system permease protein